MSAALRPPVRVMLVDDSAIVRGMIAKALEADRDLSVVATAANGKMAVQMAEPNQPDIILLDIEMPEMDGITALPLLLQVAPKCKIIMVSTLTLRNANISLQALSRGASDYIAKPTGREGQEAFYRELKEKVRALAGLPALAVAAAPPAFAPVPAPVTRPHGAAVAKPQALAVASSTGGPQALTVLLGALKGKLKHIPIFITQHMPPTFTALLAEQLARTGERPCTEAKHGDVVLPGCAYLAPGDFHMLPRREGAQVVIHLTQDPPVNFCRPAADPMLDALSAVYGSALLVAVLTGMGADGAEGARRAYAAGAGVIAQDEASCVVYGMPKATAETGVCEAILPLNEMGDYVARRC